MRSKRRRRMEWLALAGLLVVGVAAAQAPNVLPDKVLETIKSEFPGAEIRGFGRETEGGVMYYEVNLRLDRKRFEVEIDPDGTIGELEGAVGIEDVPNAVLDEFARAAGNGKIRRIEKHEVRGKPKGDRFVPLDRPKVFYEAKYTPEAPKGSCKVVVLTASSLSPNIRSTLKKTYPGGRIGEVGLEYGDGINPAVVQLRSNGRKVVARLAPDGFLLTSDSDMPLEQMPAPVAAAIRAAAGGAELRRTQKCELMGSIQSGKVVPVDPPRVTYAATMELGGKESRHEFSPEGILVSVQDSVDPQQLPPPAAKAIAKAAGGGWIMRLVSVERWIREEAGKLVRLENPEKSYQADFIRSGAQGRVAVRPDGKLISKPIPLKAIPELEDEDEEDDD